MRCVLVSCCGLPAAGKTTFCGSLVTTPVISSTSAGGEPPAQGAQLEPDTFVGGASGIRVSHVCFDDFIDRARWRRRRGSTEKTSPSSCRPDQDPAVVDRASSHSNHVAPEVDVQPEQVPEHLQGRSDEQTREQQQGHTTVSTRRVAAADSPRLPEGESIGDDIGESHADETSQHGAGLAALAEGDEDSARCWREGRRAALAEIEALAAGHGSADPAAVTPAAGSATAPAPGKRGGSPVSRSSAKHVVLADDNMHLRSMRREVYSTARKYGCGYAQVYFPTDVEIAVERNKKRRAPVAEAVIRKMAESIQPPNPDRFRWERHTAVMEPGVIRPSSQATSVVSPPTERCSAQHRAVAARGDGGDGFRGCNPVSTGGDTFGVGGEPREGGGAWDDDAGERRTFWRVIAAAAAAEDMTIPTSVSCTAGLLEKEADRQATRASLLHRFDLQLREAIKRVARRAADAALERDALGAVMSACSAARKKALHRAKEAGRNDASRKCIGQERGERREEHEHLPLIPECLPHFEQFVGDFEEALGEVRGMNMVTAIRASLIEAARNLA